MGPGLENATLDTAGILASADNFQCCSSNKNHVGCPSGHWKILLQRQKLALHGY